MIMVMLWIHVVVIHDHVNYDPLVMYGIIDLMTKTTTMTTMTMAMLIVVDAVADVLLLLLLLLLDGNGNHYHTKVQCLQYEDHLHVQYHWPVAMLDYQLLLHIIQSHPWTWELCVDNNLWHCDLYCDDNDDDDDDDDNTQHPRHVQCYD